MARGFIYVVTTLKPDYTQKAFCNVPTQWGDRLYFGPCKKYMRPKMCEGDYVFGISPSTTSPRRIVFVARIEKRMSFAEAYRRFPELHGHEGPIHVQPINGTGPFPALEYEHIPGSMHATCWKADLKSRKRDAFFVFAERKDWIGRWLGSCGPQIDEKILSFLRSCCVHGARCLSPRNLGATLDHPVAHEGLYTGLHLETNQANRLLELCHAYMKRNRDSYDLDRVRTPERRQCTRTERCKN